MKMINFNRTKKYRFDQAEEELVRNNRVLFYNFIFGFRSCRFHQDTEATLELEFELVHNECKDFNNLNEERGNRLYYLEEIL